jgi:Protein of unknown function (DUF3040)
MTAERDAAEYAMLSDHDRRTLAEIERHLQEDPALHRSFERSPRALCHGLRGFGRRWRGLSRTRRTWCALLLVSLVLMVATAALGTSGAAFECAVLAVVIGTGLRSTSRGVEHRAGTGSVPDRRP